MTSEKQRPQSHWFEIVTTAKAKQKVKDSFKLEQSEHIEKGRQIIEDELKKLNKIPSNETISALLNHFNLETKMQMYAQVGSGLINLNQLEEIYKDKKEENKLVKYWKLSLGRKKKNDQESEISNQHIDKKKTYILSEENIEKNFKLAKCCNPIPGDDVIGYLDESNVIIIHKKSCKETIKITTSEGDKIVIAKWKQFKINSFLSRIYIKGFDRIGIASDVTSIISKDHNVNMRTVRFDTNEGVFTGTIDLYIHNTEDIDNILAELNKLKGIDIVERLDLD